MATNFDIDWDEEYGFRVATRRGYWVRWRSLDARWYEFYIDEQHHGPLSIGGACADNGRNPLEEMERLVLSAVDQLPKRG